MVATLVYAAAYAVGFIAEMYAANAIFAMAVNFAVSYTVTRVFGSKPPRQQDNGVRQQVPPSANNSIPVVYGDAWMGGTFVDAVLTTDNQAMYYVLAISNISPNGQFTYDTTQFYYGDRLVTFSPGTNQVASLTDGAGNVDTKINGYLYINLYTSNAAGTITTVLGSAPNVAMGGADIPVALRWPASGRQMNGLAFAIVYLKYSQDAGSTGLQPVTFKVKHALNGTGVAKPGSVLQDYLTNTVYGGAVDIADVNTTACAALDTYADQVITYNLAGGGTATQPRYRINGVIDTGETALNNIENILLACDSWISYQAETGQWAPVINKADSTGFAFDDSNIIGEIRVSATDITSSINQIEASFPWKDNKDKPGYIFLETPAGLRYPNEPDNKYTMSFTMVNDSVQAEYLANRMLEQAREDLVVSFSTAYTGIQVNAGDVISVTNSAYGWTNKLFRAIKVNEASLPDGNLGARIECTEYNAAVYDDYSITAFAPAPNSDLQSGYYFPALSAPTVSDQAPAAQPPTFSVTCQLPSTVRVTKVTLYYTTSATPTTADWKVWGIESVSNAAAFAPGLALKFPNVNLSSATYYFAFSVENEVSTSQLSATSTALVWNPVAPSGVKTAIAFLYQWAGTIPGNPSGTSTFTWATATNSAYTGGNGWLTTIPANPGTAGFSLWVAAKEVSESAAVATTTVSWSSGFSVYAQSTNGASGTSGSSARICFARVPSNPSPISGSITTTGSASFPSSAQSLSTWGFSATWGASDPNPSSTDSLYQSDGIYDPTTGNTVWSTPYISSLKVGTLSAITVNTGALTVQNTLTVSSTGNIQGGQTGYNTGTGFFLGYSSTAYKFSIGDSFANMLWDGSSFSINNGTITGSLIQTATSGSRIALGTNIGQSSTTALVGYGSSGTRVMEFNIGFGYVSATRQSGTGPAGSFQNSVAAQALEGISSSSSGIGVYGSGGDKGVEGSAGTSAGWGGYFYNLSTATQGLYASGLQMPQGAEFRWRNSSGGIGSYVYTDGNDALYIISGASGSADPKAVLIGTKATARVRVEAAFLRPEADNTVTLGAASFRYVDVYAVSGSVNTSDEREKNILGPNPLGLDFINALQTIQYKWKVAQGAVVNNILDEDGKIIGQEEETPAREGVRTFHGLSAQQVKATLDTLGVDSFAGWVLADKDDPNSIQGLRYSEFIAPLIKAVQELTQKVNDLEARLK